MHLVIYFCGTGNDGRTFFNQNQYLNNPGVQTIFVEGCDKPNVCNSELFPDLKGFAKRFTKKVFKKGEGDQHSLVIDTAQNIQSVGVNLVHCSSDLKQLDEDDPIESITLCGYSRGAVTCFEVTRQLKKIAPNIPVDIVADQPVPGNCYQGPGTNAASIADCNDLTNLRNVSIIIGAYTGATYQDGERTVNPIHRGFFSQIVPKLPRTATRDLIVIPRESHHQNLMNAPEGAEHMHMQVAKYLNKQDKNLLSDATVKSKIDNARAQYTEYDDEPTLFPKQTKLQGIFGLSKEDAYLYADKLHPSVGLRNGYTLEENEPLIHWWKKHDKNTSRFSTKLTKNLVKSIQKTDANEVESLKNLFAECDKWLIIKENSCTSRYYQVEALRNNIYHKLIEQMKVEQSELAIINRQNLQGANYFQNHWNFISKAVSYYKTDETRKLDEAFAKHAKIEPEIGKSFVEKDKELLAAVNVWLTNKKDSKSKRWDEVIKIKEHLMEVITNCSLQEALTQKQQAKI